MLPKHMCSSCTFHVSGCNNCSHFIGLGQGVQCLNYQEREWFQKPSRKPHIACIRLFNEQPIANPMDTLVKEVQDGYRASMANNNVES